MGGGWIVTADDGRGGGQLQAGGGAETWDGGGRERSKMTATGEHSAEIMARGEV